MNKKFLITVGILLIITGITGIYMVINNAGGSWGRIVTGLIIALIFGYSGILKADKWV